MKKSMLSYCKVVLEKVSFSRKLFVKELCKFNRILSLKERYTLLNWLRVRFSTTMPDLITMYERNLKHKERFPHLIQV